MFKYAADGIRQVLVDIPLLTSLHIQVYSHYPALFQMSLYKGKKFKGGHLKGNGNILKSIYQNHIIFFIHSVQIRPAVISSHWYIFRLLKVLLRKFCNLLINFHTLDMNIIKISLTLQGKGSRPHAKDQHIQIFFFIHSCHDRCRHHIIIIHPRQAGIFSQYRLHTKQHICGEDHIIFVLFDLQVIVYGLPLVNESGLPKGKTAGGTSGTAQNKQDHSHNNTPAPSLFAHKINQGKE